MNKRITIVALAIALLCVATLVPARNMLAQSGNQWRMDFYPNDTWAGAPTFTQYSNFANFNWGYGSPAPNIPVDHFTGRFTSDAYFYAGTYRFTVLADDDMALIVDNVVKLDTRGQGQSGKTFVVDLPMTQGVHNIRLDYHEVILTSYVSVNWVYLKPDGGYVPPVTPTPVAPPSATSVQTRYGDYTSCIQQGTHQANCFQGDGGWESPNLGSIQMEPQIVYWGNCKANELKTVQIDPNQEPKEFKCSKTEAGWFPN